MLHHDARPNLDSNTQQRDAAPARDRMPTLPYDLSEYAWLHTGPASWTAEPMEAGHANADHDVDHDEADPDGAEHDDAADAEHDTRRLVTAHAASRTPFLARRCVERIARAAGAGR
jgi:hypothetical protein